MLSDKSMLINGFSDFQVGTPDCFPGKPVWVAKFKLDADVSNLFTYINAEVDDAVLFDRPEYIQFTLDGIKCALYPDNVSAVPFADREQADKFVHRLIDFLNDIDSRKNSIEPNLKKHRHISVFDIFKLLPQTNCSECGFQSCMAFANALSNAETVLNKCPELMNSESESAVKLKEILSC